MALELVKTWMKHATSLNVLINLREQSKTLRIIFIEDLNLQNDYYKRRTNFMAGFAR